MFYQDKEIDDIIRCPICQSRFQDPRILPCGSSMCHKCIGLLEKKEKKEINCPICKQTHLTPTNGFLKNIVLYKYIFKI
jgi:C4-type Zn-finger protein